MKRRHLALLLATLMWAGGAFAQAYPSKPIRLVVHPTLGVDSTQELITMAKAKPGARSYASAGNGSVGHLTVELFKSMAGLDIQHIPYKGGGSALSDLAGGQVKIMFDTLPTGLPLVKAGKVKALAVSGATRAAATTEAYAAFVRADAAEWGKVVRDSGAKIE